MATQQTQQRPSSRKAKVSTTSTEQEETGLGTALGEGTGERKANNLAEEAANNEDTGRDEPENPKTPPTAGSAPVNGSDEPEKPKPPPTAGSAPVNGSDGVNSKAVVSDPPHGYWGLIEEKLADLGLTQQDLTNLNLRPTSVVTDVGLPYCPNPKSDDNLLRGYETLLKADRMEMRKIEKVDFIKEIQYEPRSIQVPKARMEMERIEHKDQVIVVRKVAKKVPKTFYRVVEEVREVTEMVDVVQCFDVPRVEEVPRILVKDEQETVYVPIVNERPVWHTVEEPTGKPCDFSKPVNVK